MAAEDFAAEGHAPFQVKILSADHQNKADIGSQIAREWVDREGVAAIADSVNSSVGLAINQVMRERHRTFIATNVGTSDLTDKACAPTTVPMATGRNTRPVAYDPAGGSAKSTTAR